jgi:hypothetical protein
MSIKKTKCILCNEKSVKDFINLGKTALANNLINIPKLKIKKYPLIVGKCSNCEHIQLSYLPNPILMFKNYLYLSSASSTLTNHLKNIPIAVNKLSKIKKKDLVIDIGSNDGTLLSGYDKFGPTKLGVEPAKNLAKYYKNKKNNLINDFFNFKIAKKIKKKFGLAKVITATNVFPHLQRLNEFGKSVNSLLDKNGVLLIEAHYLGNLIKDTAFDTIYHEHCSYWSVSSVKKFCDLNNLELFKVDKLPIHHGQIRCWIGLKGSKKIHKSVTNLINLEKKNKLHSDHNLLKFKNKIFTLQKKINKLFLNIKNKKLTIAGYGAPAKATTFTSFFKINKSKIPYIFDKNSLKQNKFVPGSNLPILGIKKISVLKPDYLFNFAWNFIDEIYKENLEFRKNGGVIINPIPKIKFYK